ncbi:putative lipoprotein [Streptomyces venezuelae]|uniref:hypothetical protein n=1 Tax=Streptomyces gardneri TaxID=66892 RepID=UPI0006BD478B|nr:hypothetical protein [Streptomyces gardneri]ALO08911.1 putative lipoprotein [Streptomyces venezuelae]QPK46079.1 hypothetical protein H4W23_16505 [Streptomyces gardneri]WRK37438.1 hypothetical protein U0M97_16585 [Streptomyces venezuelae]CUM40701.1 putative lipoprotein [Streptomyces venezuelae]
MHALLRRPVAAAFLCTALTLPVTACGRFVGDLTKPEILGKAIRATESAGSVTVYSDGFSLAVPVKSRTSHDGRGNCTMTLSHGASDTVDVIRVDGDVYVRRDEARLRREESHRTPEDLEALIGRLKGRWTKSPAGGPDVPEGLGTCSRKVGFPRLENGWDDDSMQPTATTLDGRKALRLAKPVGGDGETTTLYMAAEGPPRFLKIVMTRGETPGTTTYDYDRPVEVKAPPADDVVVRD